MTSLAELTPLTERDEMLKVLAEYRADHNDQLEPGQVCHCTTCYRAVAILRRSGEKP